MCPVISVGCSGSLGVVGVGTSAGGLFGMVIVPLCCFLLLVCRRAVGTWSGVLVGWSLWCGRWLFASCYRTRFYDIIHEFY